MNKLLIFISIISCGIIVSCKSKSSEDKDKIVIKDNPSISNVVENSNKFEEISKKMEARMEQLKKIQPLTNDQIKVYLPETANNIKRESFNIVNSAGVVMGQSDYVVNDSVKYSVTISDGAGAQGAAFYYGNITKFMTVEREDSYGYTKTMKFNGEDAYVEYKKADDNFSIMTSKADRFNISITGSHTTLAQLEAFAKSLNLDGLNAYK